MFRIDSKLSKCIEFMWKYLIVLVYKCFKQMLNFQNRWNWCESTLYSASLQVFRTDSKLLIHIEFLCIYLVLMVYKCFKQIRNFRNASNSWECAGLQVFRTDAKLQNRSNVKVPYSAGLQVFRTDSKLSIYRHYSNRTVDPK